MSARNNIDNYASFNIRDLMPTTRNFIKAQIVEAQSVIKKATPMYNSQFHQKPLSKSILGKRSQSVHRLATISTRNEPSQDVIYVNSRKLDTMMPLGNETVETGGDENKDMNLKYKNLNRLMKSEKEIKVVPKERLIGPFAQAKKVQGENRDWQTLPEEFKKIPLFQAIYLKKKESLIDYRLLAGDDVPAYMKPNYKVPENLRFWKPSSEHKEPEEIKSQSKVDSNNKFEYDSKYYGVDTIRYQNYKYHKVLSNVKERRYSPNKMFEQKISVEFLAHDIHTQRRSIKELENQRIEIMQKREQMKNDKRLSQPRTSKQQQNVSLDHINEEDKESQKTIENNNLNKVYELNMCADMDLISRSKESSLNFIQSERELRSKKGESPKVSPRFNKGSLTERNRGGGSPEKRKGNSPSKKIATVIGSPWGIEKMYYSKECKQEFEELCQISQDWLDEMKNGGIDNERDEKALQTHMKLHSPKIDAGIYLPVFLETQGMYIRQKKFITDRILLALGLNPLNKFSMINMENFSKFQRIFVAKDASDTELVDFMIQFFKIDDNEEVLQDSFILVLKSMTDRNENYNRFAEVLNSSYDVLLENYRIFGVMRENSGFVDFDNFREVYLSNKMNISDLADLITNLN